MGKILENIDGLSKEDFSKRQLYDELFDIPNEMDRSETRFQLSEKARSFQMTGFFNNMVNLKEKEIKEAAQMKNQIQCVDINNITQFCYEDKESGEYYPNMFCGSWIATEEGIYSQEASRIKSLVCAHPIIPIKRLKNLETNEEQIVIAYKRDSDKWQTVTVPKVDIVSPRTIINLAKFGIQVDSETAKNLIIYLRDIEMYNKDKIRIGYSTGKLGWHKNNLFIPYDKSIKFDGENKFKTLFESINEHRGDYSAWVDLMIELRQKKVKEAKIALAASFASVLIQPLGALPFIVDFYGQTGGGKTVTINVAASVWGNPEAGAYVGNFRSTDVGLETRSDMLNNLPLILDDSNNASKFIKDNYETLIYNLCSGKGKARSNKELGAMKENTWKNVTICNGERPIADFADSGGAINRILEVECLEDIYSDPVKVNETVMKNYGHAGIVFIDHLKSKKVENLKKRKESIEKELDSCNVTAKQKMAASILLLADKLATECIFMDDCALKVEDIKDILAEKTRVSEGQRCYEYLLEVIETNSAHFNLEFASIEQWGLSDTELDDNGDQYQYFYINPFEEILKKKNFSRKSFMAWAIPRGLVKHNKDRDTINKKSGKKSTRYIAIKINNSDNFTENVEINCATSENDEFISVNNAMNLPFS